ncbi:hypothetical protein [Streptomyces griseoluteus]|uniref:hypothetical protein n=1 Tax=Streptomyces griseoluteus TaxID=29306 RepID=UPI0036BEF777
MTCMQRAETAACRKEKLLLGLPADDGPDQSFCRSTCVNLAYTGRDIAEHRARLPVLMGEARDPISKEALSGCAAGVARTALLGTRLGGRGYVVQTGTHGTRHPCPDAERIPDVRRHAADARPTEGG